MLHRGQSNINYFPHVKSRNDPLLLIFLAIGFMVPPMSTRELSMISTFVRLTWRYITEISELSGTA